MKTIPTLLLPQYAGAGSTLCHCLKITRTDAVVVGFTSLNTPLTVSGVLYEPGFDANDIVATSSLAVDNLELTILPDAPGINVTRIDLVAGLWDNAAFEIFEVNYLSPTDGINVLKRGTTGEVQVQRGAFVVELRGLKQALQQDVGAVTSKDCRARLGDANCRKDLTGFVFSYAATSIGADPRRNFTCSASTEAIGFYAEGIARCTSGANAGYSRKVKTSTSSGVFTMQLDFPFAIVIGDAFTFTAGCQKRLAEDCLTKFNNVVNFYGEPHLPGVDSLTADPTVGG